MTNSGNPGDRAACAVLTPVGRGAVATVGVRGPGAIEMVGRRFTAASGKPLASLLGRAVLGTFVGGQATEELVVGVVGPTELEVHCHGGTAAVEAVVAAFAAEGCPRMSAAAWAMAQEPDLLRAEALVALAEARTERTATILLDQYRGALSNALKSMQSALSSGRQEETLQSLSGLLDWRDLGLHLTRPWRVVLTGRPNVGKSTLINALVGYRRAIVSVEPGTTRDVLLAATAFDGWPVELADTAGLHLGGDALEAEGMARAWKQLRDADAVLFIVDSAVGWTAADDAHYQQVQQTINDRWATDNWRAGSVSLPMSGPLGPTPERLIIVHNKADLPAAAGNFAANAVNVSAQTGLGIEPLIARIGQCLVPAPPPAGAAVPFNQRQFELLDLAHRDAAAGQLESSRGKLESLLR